MATTSPSNNPDDPSPSGFNERFFSYFKHEVTALTQQIDALPNTSTTNGERTDAVDHCLAGIARLSQEVSDASKYLPAYDQMTYGKAVKALSEKLAETRNGFAPRPKFTFKAALKSRTSRGSESSTNTCSAKGVNGVNGNSDELNRGRPTEPKD